MKLKLDLHPIFSDGAQIEESLRSIIESACEKRAASVEIICGKGSGALKKSVIRFLNRADVRARYHRVEKDSDNWGRLFVHFRWDRPTQEKPDAGDDDGWIAVDCFCCGAAIMVDFDSEGVDQPVSVRRTCAGCGSPNRISLRRGRRAGPVTGSSASGYD